MLHHPLYARFGRKRKTEESTTEESTGTSSTFSCREQCKHCAQKQNITCKHWWKFVAIKWKEEKGRRKTVVCTNLKQTSTK